MYLGWIELQAVHIQAAQAGKDWGDGGRGHLLKRHVEDGREKHERRNAARTLCYILVYTSVIMKRTKSY